MRETQDNFLLYVDDLIVTCRCSYPLLVDQFLPAISHNFFVKYFDDIHYFFGVEVILIFKDCFFLNINTS